MMTRSDIVCNTLDQLMEKLNLNPESFELINETWTKGIVWQTKLSVNNELISDPTSYQRTISITWHDMDKTLTMCILNDTYSSVRSMNEAMTFGNKLSLSRPLEKYRKPCRKLNSLIKLVKKQKEHQKTKEFLAKISSVFPGILDHFILGK